MKKIISNNYLLLLSRVFLGFIFLYAGIEKISEPAQFAADISNYKLLPVFLVNFFSIIIPWIEVVSGILIIFGITVRENSFIISVLLGVFIIAVSVSLIRGLNIECGCFGTYSGSMIGWQKIGENILLTLLGIQLIFFGGGRFSIQSLVKDDIIIDSRSEY